MRILLGTTLFIVAGCDGNGADGGGADDGTNTIPDPDPQPEDTGWPPGQVSHMQITHDAVANRTRAYAMFSQNDFSFVNVAQCAIEGTVCFPPFPKASDPPVEIDTDEFDQENVSTVFAGFQVTMGPYTLPYVEEPETDFGSYSADVSNQPFPVGWIGVSWGGAWKPYEGTEDLYVSPPIELISPAPGSHIRFTNGEELVIEWVPTGEGEVTIAVAPGSSDSLLFTVEDDGYEAFDVDIDLANAAGDPILIEDTEEVTFTITRWNESELRKYGHVIELVANSTATFTSTYNNIGTRTRIIPPDTCTEAQGSATLPTGGYWGYLDPYVNDIDPIATADCPSETINSDARGNEAFVRLELDPYETVNVDYNAYDVSAATYLLEDCDDINTCLIAADASDSVNEHEFVNYFNNTDDQQTLFLGLDSSDKGDGVFTLDLVVTDLADPEMYDSCDEAKGPYAAVTSSTATYFETFTSYTADLNPGIGGCTNTSLPGNDAILVIEVASNATATVLVTMDNGDPGIYLLTDCANPFAGCVVGSDVSFGNEEKFTYTNVTTVTERLYLVVDSKSGLQPFFVSVTL